MEGQGHVKTLGVRANRTAGAMDTQSHVGALGRGPYRPWNRTLSRQQYMSTLIVSREQKRNLPDPLLNPPFHSWSDNWCVDRVKDNIPQRGPAHRHHGQTSVGVPAGLYIMHVRHVIYPRLKPGCPLGMRSPSNHPLPARFDRWLGWARQPPIASRRPVGWEHNCL